MLLKDFISNNKNYNEYNNKHWIDYINLYNHFNEENIPGKICEEWKNFDTSDLINKSWIVPQYSDKKIGTLTKTEYKNSIVLLDGVYNQNLSNIENFSGISVLPLENYINTNEEGKKLVYNSPLKYSENRLSGKVDTKPTTLLSINMILNKGVVIISDIKDNPKESIKIVNLTTNKNTFINPYVLVICNNNTTSNFVDISSNSNNNWVNPFYEFYIKDNANLSFASIQGDTLENYTTGSLNFHVHKEAKLNLSLFNRESSKNDVRVFLKEKGANVEINGLLASSKNKESDIFCKVVHSAKNTRSYQNWRLVSTEESKTSVIGKIVVNKGANKSDAKFFSKSLILNQKASSFSRPELEIFEGDISCSHGASFGEIDKDLVFYLQSRGIKKKDAIKMLLLSFINETGIKDEFVSNFIFNQINYYL